MVCRVIHKSAKVAYTCEQMFDLVQDVDSYCHFLPYCTDAKILSTKGNIVEGQMVFTYMGLSYSLVTKNSMYPHSRIGLLLLEGDLQSLKGQWLFCELNGGGCKVSLDLEIGMYDGLWYSLYNRLLDRVANMMVEKFIERAYQIYGI